MRGPLNIRGDMCSVTGDKERNEDYALVLSPVGACLADGMGGERMGGVIARCACTRAMRSLSEGRSASQSLDHAQSFSRELVDNLRCGRGGAALTVVRCGRKDLQVAWAGDVLCMHLSAKSGELKTLTKPDRGERGITNAVGMDGIRPNVASCELAEGDRVLLCSDGVWEDIRTDEILDALRLSRTPREAAVRLVMGRGHSDDATAIVLFVDGAAC